MPWGGRSGHEVAERQNGTHLRSNVLPTPRGVNAGRVCNGFCDAFGSTRGVAQWGGYRPFGDYLRLFSDGRAPGPVPERWPPGDEASKFLDEDAYQRSKALDARVTPSGGWGLPLDAVVRATPQASANALSAAATAGVSTGAVVTRVANRIPSALRPASKGGAAPVRTGQAGEAAVRSVFDIGSKARININGRWRIPDGMTTGTLSEVKNVRSLGLTRQLRDYADYAKSKDLDFDLYVRPDTRLSPRLLDAADKGLINLKLIPQ